jgi:hypothetical protein
MYSFSVGMIQRRISEAQRWQIFGMHTTGMSSKAIGRQMGYHYTVVSRLVKKHTNQQCERLAKIVTTRHCSVWLDGCHSQTVPYSNNTGCPIDVCQQKQLETVWNQWDWSQGESLNVQCWQTDINEHVWHGA